MFWFDNEFCFKNEYIRFFVGTLVGKRKQTIFKKRWFDITIQDTYSKEEASSVLFILTANEHILTGYWLQIVEVAITPVGMSVQ